MVIDSRGLLTGADRFATLIDMGKFWTVAKDSECPECKKKFSVQGLPGHRSYVHGVGERLKPLATHRRAGARRAASRRPAAPPPPPPPPPKSKSSPKPSAPLTSPPSTKADPFWSFLG